MNTKEYQRINFLLGKYKHNRISTGEQVSREYKAEIDRQIHNRHKRNDINKLLTEVNNPQTIKREVYAICDEIGDLKKLCRNCKFEQIVSVIILYVQRQYNQNMKEEKTRLWNHYDLSWKLYGRIVARLLRETRKSKPLPREVK